MLELSKKKLLNKNGRYSSIRIEDIARLSKLEAFEMCI